MKRTIHIYGDPVLREKAAPVYAVTSELAALAQDMIETMHAANGVGLAAQQIGERAPLCVIDLPPEMDQDEDGQAMNEELPRPLVLVNPELLETSDTAWTREEGCLSFPDILGRIERPWTIRVRYMDLEGQRHERTCYGMLARVIQHEMDHLSGVLFIDRMSHVKRLALKGRLKRLREETEAV